MCKFAIPFVVLICLQMLLMKCCLNSFVLIRIMICERECTCFMTLNARLGKKKPLVNLAFSFVTTLSLGIVC
ncbi:TPA: hypothetical protein JD396_01920 [Citrobacter freundii]|nr:hypothetical protein [Citrobacter freundii]HAU5813551.1 hypothetical protein [Citrobacter freundii]